MDIIRLTNHPSFFLLREKKKKDGFVVAFELRRVFLFVGFAAIFF